MPSFLVVFLTSQNEFEHPKEDQKELLCLKGFTNAAFRPSKWESLLKQNEANGTSLNDLERICEQMSRVLARTAQVLRDMSSGKVA